MHSVGTILAVRAEILALLDDLPAVVRVYSELLRHLALALQRAAVLHVLILLRVLSSCVSFLIVSFGGSRRDELPALPKRLGGLYRTCVLTRVWACHLRWHCVEIHEKLKVIIASSAPSSMVLPTASHSTGIAQHPVPAPPP